MKVGKGKGEKGIENWMSKILSVKGRNAQDEKRGKMCIEA